MATYTNPLDLYNHMRLRFARTNADLRSGHEALADDGLADWREITSGTISTSQLRAMGHPYGRGANSLRSTATGRLRGHLRGLPINRQSGRLQGSLRKSTLQIVGADQAFAAGPTASAGRSLFVLLPAGTRKMVARGAQAEISKRWRARNKALLDHVSSTQRGQI